MYTLTLASLGVMNVILLAVYLQAFPKMSALGRFAFGGAVFAWFPAFWGLAMVLHGIDDMKRVEFCNSCHPMESYVNSLQIDDSESLPAAHFQNNRVDQATACYSCHTEYSMFGGVKAKISGLKHVYVQYFGTIPDKIELYNPYANRDCEQCHATAKNYLDTHVDDLEDIRSGEMNCLDCHDVGHVFKKAGG